MFPPPPARSQYSVLIRSRLRVGVGVGVKVGFKHSVRVLHRLGREGCYVGKGNEKKLFRHPRRHDVYGW